MEIQKNMAVVLRTLKQESGKSISEFAEDLEISRSALQEYLSGNGNPSLSTIEHLADRLRVDSSFLVSGSFSGTQIEVLLNLLNGLNLLSELNSSQHQRFAELLLEIIDLWNKNESKEGYHE